jgi:FkbM family methyltransferase
MRYFNALYAAGLWDDDIQAILEATLKPGDTFFDVGAHCGFHTLGAAARVGQNGQVYAFEPAPARVADIQRHKDANGLSQITVVPMAVSEVDGAEVSFYVYEAASGLSSLRHPGMDGASQISVKTVTLDQFAEKEGEKGFPALIKVDIEGAEHLALRGAKGLLARPKPPTWLIELHYEDAAREVLYLLGRAGYDVRTTDGAAIPMTVIRQLSPLRLVEHIIAVHPSSLPPRRGRDLRPLRHRRTPA